MDLYWINHCKLSVFVSDQANPHIIMGSSKKIILDGSHAVIVLLAVSDIACCTRLPVFLHGDSTATTEILLQTSCYYNNTIDVKTKQ